jgi:hypothetical protein
VKKIIFVLLLAINAYAQDGELAIKDTSGVLVSIASATQAPTGNAFISSLPSGLLTPQQVSIISMMPSCIETKTGPTILFNCTEDDNTPKNVFITFPGYPSVSKTDIVETCLAMNFCDSSLKTIRLKRLEGNSSYTKNICLEKVKTLGKPIFIKRSINCMSVQSKYQALSPALSPTQSPIGGGDN